MPVPRYRIKFTGPVSKGVVGWLMRLIPLLREAPRGAQVTVEIDYSDDPPGHPEE